MKAIEVIYPIIKEFRCALRLRNTTISKPTRKRKLAVSTVTNKRSYAVQVIIFVQKVATNLGGVKKK